MGKYFKLLLLIAILSIEFLATTTTVHIGIVENMWDKANHFIAFFTLYILVSLSFTNMKTSHKTVWLILFGIQIELIQHFIEGRFFSLMDIIADIIGIAISIVTYKVFLAILVKLKYKLDY